MKEDKFAACSGQQGVWSGQFAAISGQFAVDSLQLLLTDG
jgi:hypothetical protein